MPCCSQFSFRFVEGRTGEMGIATVVEVAFPFQVIATNLGILKKGSRMC